MTNEELVQSLLIVSGASLAGWAGYRLLFQPERRRPLRTQQWRDLEDIDYDDFPEAIAADDLDEQEPDWDKVYEELYGHRGGPAGRPVGRVDMRPYLHHGSQLLSSAGQAGLKYGRWAGKKALKYGEKYGKQAADWTGKQSRSAYEAARSYDYAQTARDLGTGVIDVGRQMDALSHMDAPRRSASYVARPVSPTITMEAVRPTMIMDEPPRMTAFGEPAPSAFVRNRRSRRRRR